MQATATSRAARRVAQKLQRRLAQATRHVRRAAQRTGEAQAREYSRASAALQRLLAIARLAASAGTLDASLSAIETAGATALAAMPS